MEIKKINYWIIVITLTLSSSWVMLFYNKKDITQETLPLVQIPYEVNNWQGKDIELSEDIFQILGTDKVMLREYRNPEDDTIWLYLVYSEKNRTSFHPPEYCYIGGGNTELIEKDLVKIPIGEESLLANRLVFQTPRGMQMVIFWFTADKRMYASYYKQQLDLVLNTIKGKESQGVMVRLSTYVQTEDKEEEFKKMKIFIKDLIPYLRK